MQMLYSIPEFRQFILTTEIDAEPFVGLRHIFERLQAPGSAPIDIKDDFISLRGECMTNLTPVRLIKTQEDVREFLNDCIFRKIEFLGLMPDFLSVVKKSRSICNGVPDEESGLIPGTALIPIDFTTPDIQGNLLSTLYEESALARCPEGYTKTTFFTGAPPKYFIFPLSRFVYDRNAQDQIKIKNQVEINNILRVPFDDGFINYRIKGYISHFGNTAKEGHYYYSAKGDDGKWRIYNDTTIEMAPSYNKEGMYLNVSATEKKRAYIFLYELDTSAPHVPVNTLSSGLQQLTLSSSGRPANNITLKVNKKPNVTRGRKLNKKGAKNYIESRTSISPNTAKRAVAKIRVRPVGTEFTENNIQEIVNRTRRQKAEEKKGKK